MSAGSRVEPCVNKAFFLQDHASTLLQQLTLASITCRSLRHFARVGVVHLVIRSFVCVCMFVFTLSPGKVTKLSGEFIPNGDFKSTKKLTWLAKVTYTTRALYVLDYRLVTALVHCSWALFLGCKVLAATVNWSQLRI